MREPDLLLLDEPFGALDALTRIAMHGLVLDLWQRHRPGVLLVTHDVDEALLLAGRVLVLDGGRIVAEHRPREAADHDDLRRRVLADLGVTEDARGVRHCPSSRRRSCWPGAARRRARTRGRPAVPGPVSPADLAKVTLKVGDQKGGVKSLLTAAGQLDGTPYKIEWSTFTSGPPLLEAASAGAIDIGRVGNTPPIFAAAAKAKIAVVSVARSNVEREAILVPPDSPLTDVASLRARRSGSRRAVPRTASC